MICGFDTKVNDILKTNIPADMTIQYSPKGLWSHVEKKHKNCLPYLECLEEFILSADYVGQQKKQGENSFELVKVVQENVLIAIQFDSKDGYLYVASVYDISNTKLENRLYSGRMKPLR